MNQQSRQLILVFIAVATLTVFVGERLILGPIVDSWRGRSAQIQDLRRKVTQGTLLVEREQAIRDRWEGMRTNALSREVSVAESQLLNAFDRWSRESAVGISAIRPQWKRGPDDSMILECRADVFGDLKSLTRFLYLIEADTLAVKIEALELSSRDPQAEQLNLVLQVSGLMLRPAGS